MTRAGRAVAAVACALAASAFAAPAFDAPMPEDEAPTLVGVWEFRMPESRCTETYLFKPNGTSLVTSGQEISEIRYSLRPEPGTQGFYKLEDEVTEVNGRQDCEGSVTQLGQRSTNFIRFDPSGDLLIMCRDASFSACYGPLMRVSEQDS